MKDEPVATSDTSQEPVAKIEKTQHMTHKEQIMSLSAGRAHMGTMMDLFEMFGNWESYFRACNLFHMYDELLKAKLKEKNNG